MEREYKISPTSLGFTFGYDDFVNGPAQNAWDFMMDFIYHSNAIENIYDDSKIIGVSYEVRGHKAALDYVIDNHSRLPLRRDIREIHRRLMNGCLPEHFLGNYRQEDVFIMGDGCVVAAGIMLQKIGEEISYLEDKIYSCPSNWKGIWEVHHRFETIHPFIDGNGRTGRLLLNWLSLNKMGKFYVVDVDQRLKYYERINCYRDKFLRSGVGYKFPDINILNDRLREVALKRVISGMIESDRVFGID